MQDEQVQQTPAKNPLTQRKEQSVEIQKNKKACFNQTVIASDAL
jgi:hypothetical protein